MVDFAKYAFNKSHAACYALIAVQTAWLKFYYPAEYAAALCTSVIDNARKLVAYVQAYKAEGMEFLPPDMNRSEAYFSPEDGKVRFGLAGIKGVGFELASKVIKSRPEGGFASVEEVIDSVIDSAGNSKCVESLALAGAFSGFGGNRRQYWTALPGYLRSESRDRRKKTPGQVSLFDMPAALETGFTRMTLPDLEEFGEKELLRNEKEALGLYVTSHPLEKEAAIIRRHGTATTSDLSADEESGEAAVRDGEYVKVCGIITSVKIAYTRKDAKPMAFVTLEDLYGECEVVVFPRQFEAVRGMLNEDEEVIVGGKAQYDGEDGSAKILTEEMTRFADVPKTLCVRFEDMESYEAEKEYLENKAKKGGDSLCVCVGRRPHMKRKILRNAIDAAEMAGAFEERYGKKNVAVTA